MAKSQRSKVKRRWRALKRVVIEEKKVGPEISALNQKLQATIENRQYRQPKPKNAFLYPQDPEAVIPKHVPQPIIDLRSQAIPQSGTQFIGAYRKKKNESIQQHVVEKTINIEPEMDEEEAQPIVEEGDDLINAMEGVKLMSKNEKRKLNRQKAMEIIPLETQKQIKKNRRKKEAPRRKSKKLITF